MLAPIGGFDDDEVLGVELEVLGERVADEVGQRRRDGDAHDRAEAAAAHALLDRLEQVLGLELLDRDVGVTRHAEGMRLDHLHAREDRAEVRGDELLEPDEVVGAAALVGALHLAGRARALRRADRHEPRKRPRHLDAGEALLALGRADEHREVQAQVRDVRERARRVEGERGQHRVDDVVEVAVGVLALVLVELVVAEHVDAVLASSSRSWRVESAPAHDELAGGLPDDGELLGGGQPVGRKVAHARPGPAA